MDFQATVYKNILAGSQLGEKRRIHFRSNLSACGYFTELR